MYFKYGSKQFTNDEINLASFTQRTTFARGVPQFVTKTMTLQGLIIPSTATQAAIKTEIADREAAFSFNDRSVGLYHDDGTVSPHFLDTTTAIGGVRVVSFDFPTGDSAEYATGRSYVVAVEADYAASGNILTAFSESLRFVGTAGPRKAWVQTRNGLAQRQIVNRRTTQTVSQTGNAVGYLAEPSPPPPIFPSLEHEDRREFTPGAPELVNDRFINWPISWAYHFESNSPLNGRPNRR